MPKTNATMKRWDLINRFIRTHDYSRYLEIGVSTGKHFKRVECRLKKCVDPAQGKYSHANPTCKMTSDEFFETVALPQGKTYNLIFIDGLHESAQMDKDIAGALACLRPAGTVMLHDCNPLDERRQTTPGFREPGTAMSGRAWSGSEPAAVAMVVSSSTRTRGWVSSEKTSPATSPSDCRTRWTGRGSTRTDPRSWASSHRGSASLAFSRPRDRGSRPSSVLCL